MEIGIDARQSDAIIMRMNNGIKKRLTISVSSPQEKWLKSRARKLGISISEILRRIVDEQMTKETTNA